MHLTSSPVDWYAARAAGVVAYVLLTIVVSFGLTMSSRRRLERWPRFALEEVHRFGGILVGTFIAIHVVTIAIDSYLRFFAAGDDRAVRRLVPAAMGCAGDRRRRVAARARDHESFPRPVAVRALACLPLRELRGLDGGDGARARERHATLFEEEKVIVEIDTWDTHNSHESFQSDRKRDAVAAEHGFLTVRLISDLLRADPHGEAASLLRTLANRRPPTSS